MAVFGGDAGNAAWTNYDTQVFAWQGSIDSDVFDYLTFAAADAKGAIQGPYNMKGTLSCYLDDAVGADVVASGAASVELVLTAKAGVTFTFNAVLTQLAPAASCQAGPNTLTVGFQSNGAVAIAP